MLDIKYIKEKPQEVIDRLAKKGKDAAEDIQAILDLDAKRRELIAGVEAASFPFLASLSMTSWGFSLIYLMSNIRILLYLYVLGCFLR